ncbi:uncharacterized protein LOC113584155 isoform X4 [Electrophorus electricus]|uniref:uncharacterized protein LOC113584155 isoform X4 n=1 Tax=Electrophorus electricus TaxID=8005 RepID=UPI000F09C53F|nr:uncharacterized protein LOC113584155 isoform X4 [Electrophorus electricus]
MTVTLKVVLLLFMWSTQAEDILTPSVDIIGELRKIKIIEDKMKKMESEIKDLKFSNTVLSIKLRAIQEDIKTENTVI